MVWFRRSILSVYPLVARGVQFKELQPRSRKSKRSIRLYILFIFVFNYSAYFKIKIILAFMGQGMYIIDPNPSHGRPISHI